MVKFLSQEIEILELRERELSHSEFKEENK